ncbi:MAG: hypothetical protein GC145_13820 [Caulobacter sp.]|nr:hypothetical protein [Caulobacter sp.]
MPKSATLASALVLLALPVAASAAEPLDGVWEGAYTCYQGKTGLTLTLDATPSGEVTGTFAFWPRGDNPGVPSGRFAVRGRVTAGGELELHGDHWINQPTGYAMVGLSGKAYAGQNGDKDVLVGRVTDLEGCTEWAARRK